MALINVSNPTLLDITSSQDPDGGRAVVAEILNKKLPLIQDMPWKTGNLSTGERVSVRNSIGAGGTYRRMNQGVGKTKGTVAQFDEVSGILEDRSEIDREVAILSGNAPAERALHAKAIIEGMGQTFDRNMWYGNVNANPDAFQGLTPRFNTLAGGQVIDAGGTGSNLFSIWLINWGLDTVHGIYPKNTVGGLHHADTTTNRNDFGDGHWTGDYLLDDNGQKYLGYTDHFMWRHGLAVRDRRHVVRIANISRAQLSKDFSTGPDLQFFLDRAMGDFLEDVTENTFIYAPRQLITWAGIQNRYERRNFSSRMDGRRGTTYNDVMFRRADGLATNETQVV